MSLRKQKTKKASSWTLDELKSGFEEYYKIHGRYPTATEVDDFDHLPTSRTLQRQFGGIVALRKTLGLEGQDDFRTGEHSTQRALLIGKRANTTEMKTYVYLCERFGKELVHREYFFTDDARTRADFFVYDAEGEFCVDVLYPSNRRNLLGCINSKLPKYSAERMQGYPIIFLQMNPNISQDEIDQTMNAKKIPLHKNQRTMGWEAFVTFCESRKPRKI
jgi:hypothetical protein